jgi:hypothetical protein
MNNDEIMKALHDDNTEDIPACDDFAELHNLLANGGIDKWRIWTNIDEDIVRVFYGKKMIFSAEVQSFVFAFFMNYDVNIDENQPER